MKIHGLDYEISNASKSRNWNKCVEIIKKNIPEHDTVYKQLQSMKSHEELPLVAADKGYVELIQVLLYNGLNVDEKIQHTEETMLHVAAQCGNNNVVELLLSNDGDIEVRDNDECAPLHSAAYDGRLSTVELLIQEGADINTRNKANWTPLHYAVWCGHITVVQCLLDNNCDREIKNNTGKTALDIASEKGYSNIVRILLDN